jgi:hypothetical protein
LPSGLPPHKVRDSGSLQPGSDNDATRTADLPWSRPFLYLKAFPGRCKKPDFWLRFESVDAANGCLEKWLKTTRAKYDASLVEREKQKVHVNPFAVGDVLMGTCLPVPSAFVGEVKRKRFNRRGEVKIDTSSTAEALSFTIEEGGKIYKKSYWSSYA